MNMRADVSRPTSVPLPSASLLPASLVPLSPEVAAVVFDGGQAVVRPGERVRLGIRLDGRPLTRPLISTSLDLADGGRRHVALIGTGAGSLAKHRLDLSLGDRVVAAIDPNWLQPALADGGALTDGLSDEGRRRLLKLFLTTGASIFGQSHGSAFARASRELMALMGVRSAEILSCSPVGRAGHILCFQLPLAPEDCVVGELVALDSPRIRRLAGFRQHAESNKGGARLHLFLPGEAAPSVPLASIGAVPVLLPAPDAEAGFRPLVPWLGQASASARDWAEALIGTLAAHDPATALLVQELRHATDAPPALAVRHLSATPRGLLLSLALADPNRLIRGVQVERGGASMILAAGEDGWPSTRIARYLALPRTDWRNDACRVRLVFQSGRLHTVQEGPLTAFDGTLPADWEPEAAPELAAALGDLDTASAPRRLASFGIPAAKPSIGLLVAVGDNLDLIRARAAMIFREAGCAGIELVYHAPEGDLARAAAAALAAAEAVYGPAHRLVTVPAGTSPSRQLLAALAEVRAGAVLLLGADVLPAAPGWLAALRRAAKGPAPVLAPLLLGPDGALRSGPYLGLPADALPTAARRKAAAAIGADCALLTRPAIEMLAGFTRPYPNPDIVLAEIAARLEAEGFPTPAPLRPRFVRYREQAKPGALEQAVDAAALSQRLAPWQKGEVSE